MAQHGIHRTAKFHLSIFMGFFSFISFVGFVWLLFRSVVVGVGVDYSILHFAFCMATVERDVTLSMAMSIGDVFGDVEFPMMDGHRCAREGRRLVIIYLGLSVIWNSALPFSFWVGFTFLLLLFVHPFLLFFVPMLEKIVLGFRWCYSVFFFSSHRLFFGTLVVP